MEPNVTSVFFSPGGTTAAVAGRISASISQSCTAIDLLRDPLPEEKTFSPDHILVAAMPVFAGRIPGVCVDPLRKLKGSGSPAVAAVVYGNRAYEDALLELTDILTGNDFRLAGGAAVVARHSIFPRVAGGRPDREDLTQLDAFGRQCAQVIGRGAMNGLSVPGNNPYRKTGTLPFYPTAGGGCNRCGVCAALCPAGAISCGNPRQTDQGKCINCTACIYGCPQGARRYRGIKYRIGARTFEKRYAARQDPEFFYPGAKQDH